MATRCVLCLGMFVGVSAVHDVNWYAREFDRLLRHQSSREVPADISGYPCNVDDDPAGSVPLDDLQAPLDRAWNLGGTWCCFKHCELSRSRGSLCDLCIKSQKISPLNSFWWRAHGRVQNVSGYGTVMQIWSISGADDVPPARRCGTYAPVSAKKSACKSILCRFEIAAPCGGATSSHPRKKLGRTQMNEACFSYLGWDWCCDLNLSV